MQVYLHTLFLEYATETGGNKCKAVLYTYKQIGMRSLELFWPCLILAKNLGDVLARSLSHQGLEALLIEGLRAKRAYIEFWPIFIFCRIELIFGRLTCFDMRSIVP